MSNSERTEELVASGPSFAEVGLLRAARVNPVALTRGQTRFGVDNQDNDERYHHDSHHDAHRSARPR